MKGLLVTIIIAVLIAVPALAAAKTVVYVGKQNCAGLNCTCLPAEDRLFCDRLHALGYDVAIDSEGDVKDNSVVWKADSAKADLIFLGDVSDSMTDKNKNQSAFCGNVKSAGKKVFATFGSAYKNRSFEGCAFPLALASYPADDNTCPTSNIWVTEQNYITKGFGINDIKDVYTSAQPAKLNYGQSTASAHCDPSADSMPTSLYSVVLTSGRGTFWGLDKPSKFTDTGWTLFERAVLFTTGDNVWNVTYFTVPSKVSAGKAFMLFADVRSLARPITTGEVNVSFSGAPLGELAYNNATGHWENRALTIQTNGALTVNSEEGLGTQQMQAGTLEVRIISGSYLPGQPYSAKAQVYAGGAQSTADLNYRLLDSKLSVVFQGTMTYLGGTYYADFTPGDLGNLILEVTAANGPNTGGAFKLLRPQNATVSYSITPNEWVITAVKPGTGTMAFTVSGGELTGLTAEKSGELADNMIVNVNSTGVAAGAAAKITAKIDWTALKEGEHTGEIFVSSDQFSATVPIRFAYFKLTGDWLEAEPKVIKVAAPTGKTGTYSIKLFNTANIPTSDIAVSASEQLVGLVSFAKEPYYINQSGSRDVTLVFDASNLDAGTYSGTVTVTSSLGTADVVAELDVTPDVSQLLGTLETDWTGELSRLTEGGATLNPTASQLSQSINETVAGAREALASGDYNKANTLYQSALSSLEKLQKEQKASGTDWLLILIILAVLGGLGYFGWNFYKKNKKKPEEKKTEMPKAEEGYRTEYY
jgi:hypothetical protein